MTEHKLQQAVNALPEPGLDYLAIEEAAKKHRASPSLLRKKRRRVALMLCLSLLLVGCVAGPTVPEYHLYNGNLDLLFPGGIAFDAICDEIGWDPELDSAEKAAENLGWTIPQTLGKSPQIGADKYNLTTQESHYLLAMLFHHYTYHSVSYGYEMETEVTREDGTSSTAHWTDADVCITFGSMDNEVWHRQFGFDENYIWTGSNIGGDDPVNRYSMEYNGVVLYVATYYSGENFFYGLVSDYRQYIHWIDYDRNTVFSLYARDDTPDFAIACAQELIDSMH